MALSRLAHATATLAMVAGCSKPLEPPGTFRPEGVLLLAGVSSYMTPEDAKRNVTQAGDWRIIASQPWPPTDPRPRFSQLTVDVDAVECGQRGVLRLHFVNELLVRANFTPEDMAACQQTLPTGGAFSEEGTEDGHRRFWLYTGPGENPFIGVLDIRLQSEVNDWIRAYS